MDYDLSRIDYTISGITYPDTLKILPSSQKGEQKIAIGDKNGVLQCLSIKDEEPVVHFKTLPGKPITSVQLASTLGTQADKIFTASGNEVKGYTRKGKVFLSMETALSETITSMCILGSDLILCSGRTVTYYRDLREYNSYICEDRVLDLAAFASTRVRLLVLVANKGAIILDSGKLISRISVPSGPSRLAVPPLSHVSDIYSFYGASDGSVGLLIYEEFALRSKSLVEGGGLGAVVCLGWYYNNVGCHLAVGRHDGSIQLYLIDMENLGEKPRLKFTYFCGEPVTSVAGGYVGTEEPTLIAATFSGRIFALRQSNSISGSKLPPEFLAARRTRLEGEVARLEKQTANERERYQRNTRSFEAGLSTPPLLDIQYELLGATSDGWQEIRLTSAVPLDMLFIYCNLKLDMETDTAAVLSICSTNENTSDLLASVRCQAGTRRVWVKLRYSTESSIQSRLEGKRVLLYVLPAGAPRVARLVSLKLPALPFFYQHGEPDTLSDTTERVWCELQVTGSFSVAEMTSWLTEALPGELPRPTTNISFVRSHSLLGSILSCQYQRGQAVFKSDNVSAIAVIRNIVSNCSVEKSIKIEISSGMERNGKKLCFILSSEAPVFIKRKGEKCLNIQSDFVACLQNVKIKVETGPNYPAMAQNKKYIPDSCCIQAFKNIETKFKTEYQKDQDIIFKNAISMLDLDSSMNEEGPVLCQDYARIWDSRDKIHGSQFNEFVETIIQWYTDWRAMSLCNNSYNNETMNLGTALKECNLENISKILMNIASPKYV